MSTGLLVAAWFAVSASLVAVTAWRVAVAISPAGGRLDRWLVGLLVAVAEVVAVLQALGAARLLYAWAVLVAEGAVAAATWRITAAAAARAAPRSPRWSPRLGALLAAPPAVGLGTLAIAQSVLAGPSLDFDTMRYHAVNAAQWMTAHGTWSLPFAEPSDNGAVAPGNGELVDLWFMLPLHGDSLVGLGNVCFGALCILALAVIARELGGAPWTGALAAVAVLAAPVTYLSQFHSMETDLAVCAGLLCAVAISLGGRTDARLRWPALAGVALGIAAGSKMVAVPLVVAALVAVVALRPCARLRGLAAAAAPAVLLSAFWYVRNAVEAGNPLYPRGVSLLGHQFFAAGADAYTALEMPLVAHLLTPGHGEQLRTWLSIVLSDYRLPLVLMLAAVLPVALVMRRSERHVLITGGAAVAFFCLYTAMPFTGGDESATPLYVAGVVRFSLPAAFLGVAIVAASLRTVAAAIFLGVQLALDAVRIADPGMRPDLRLTPAIVAVAALMAMAVAIAVPGVRALRRRDLGGTASRIALTVAGVACAVGLGVAGSFAGAAAEDGPVQAALAAASSSQGIVVVLHTSDVRALLGSGLDARLVAVGSGPQGAMTPIDDGASLTRAVEALHPALVAVGDDGIADRLPPGWHPPPSWVVVGHQGACTLYRVASG